MSQSTSLVFTTHFNSHSQILTFPQQDLAALQQEQLAIPQEKSTASPQENLTLAQKESWSRKSLSEILDYVRRQGQGEPTLPSSWNRFYLRADDYSELLAKVTEESDSVQGFWEEKVKYDYFPSISTFVIRMASVLHERFCERVVREIVHQLQNFKSDFAQNVESFGSPSLKFPDGYRTHVPDKCFAHEEAICPGVIIEVSYSQKRKDLDQLARDYILGSQGNIRAVVGLDIEYQIKGKNGSKRATISVWRPNFTLQSGLRSLTVCQEVVDLEFRDEYGVANTSPDAGLSLSLSDFGPPVSNSSTPLTEKVWIPATTLAEFLVKAEKSHMLFLRFTDPGPGTKFPWVAGTVTVDREGTPVEEVSGPREKWFTKKEEASERREMEEDEDWTPNRYRG